MNSGPLHEWIARTEGRRGDVCRMVGRIHIPACMGCAAGGHRNCTCPTEADYRRIVSEWNDEEDA